jgi:hypothetical protein
MLSRSGYVVQLKELSFISYCCCYKVIIHNSHKFSVVVVVVVRQLAFISAVVAVIKSKLQKLLVTFVLQ